jgi:hypothetical protein
MVTTLNKGTQQTIQMIRTNNILIMKTSNMMLNLLFGGNEREVGEAPY